MPGSLALSPPDVVYVALLVAREFERNQIDYFLGGSLASSFQGEPRATNDIDFVVSMSETQVDRFASALGEAFLIDPPALQQAMREGRAWNIIHLDTVTKIDLIPRGTGAFDRSEFERRERVEVREGEWLYVKRPEDTVLRKLLWYREGGGVSDRQWRDVLGVLRHSAKEMDVVYLAEWARALGVADLLDAAKGTVTGHKP